MFRIKTSTAGSCHNQIAINPLWAFIAKTSIDNFISEAEEETEIGAGKGWLQGRGDGQGNSNCDAKNRQVAHTKLDSKIGICVEKFPAHRICGQHRQLGQLIKGQILCVSVPICVCVWHVCHMCVCSFCNPAKVDTFCNVKRKLAAVAVGVGFFIGFAWFTFCPGIFAIGMSSSQKVRPSFPRILPRPVSLTACLPADVLIGLTAEWVLIENHLHLAVKSASHRFSFR